MRLVIGAGADATRAAACLAATGQAVLLVQECETAHGLSHPSLPEGTGHIRVPGGMQAAIESVTGPLIAKDTVRRAVAARGHRAPLPMSVTDVPRLFGVEALRGVGQQFLERRVRNALVPLTGEGQEERTYRQWVERRMGRGAYRHVYSDYAVRRWGRPGDELAVGLARLHHNPHESATMAPSDGGHEGMHDAAIALIEANGGEIRSAAKVGGFKVVDGSVSAVKIGRRNVPVEGPVWVARPHAVVAGWLGDALDSGAHVDARSLQTLDRLQVAFEADAALPVDELHILDEGAPAFRITQVFGGGFTVVFHANLGADQPTPDGSRFLALGEEMGLRLKGDSMRVERLKDWVPVWAPLVHSRLRRLSLAFSKLGIVMVGRRGSFAPLDVGTELAVASRYAQDDNPDQREMLRTVFAPPVKDDDLDASFRDFLWR